MRVVSCEYPLRSELRRRHHQPTAVCQIAWFRRAAVRIKRLYIKGTCKGDLVELCGVGLVVRYLMMRRTLARRRCSLDLRRESCVWISPLICHVNTPNRASDPAHRAPLC